MKITFKGKPFNLVGRTLKTGTIAPSFTVTSPDLNEVTLADFKDKIKVITSFISLDTPVCDSQVKEFNTRVKECSKDAVILAISKDLPFAQKRFCDSFSIQNLSVLSDYKTSDFGMNYGVLIKEWNLLARTIWILDQNNMIRYIQIVGEITNPPNYKDAFLQLEEVVKTPVRGSHKEAFPSHCVPCEGKVPSLPKERVDSLLPLLKDWVLVEEKKIVKEFKFLDFVEASFFFNLVAKLAEEQGHHPAVTILYNKVKITLSTHAANGLTENDFVMAKMINDLQF